MKQKIIITGNLGDLNCLKKNCYTKDYLIISVDDTGRLSNTLITEITNNKRIDELIMLLSTDPQQRSFFYMYRDLFADMKFGFVHFLNGETIEFALKNRTTTKKDRYGETKQ